MLTKFEALGVELELVKPNVHFLRLDTKKMSEKKKSWVCGIVVGVIC